MINKKIGEDFEKELLNILKLNNFWATKLKEKQTGGPCDIIATKNNIFISIEAKNIENKTRFPKERIESNQNSSYKRLCEVGSDKNTFFAFKTPKGIFLLHAKDVIENDLKSIEVTEGVDLEEWLKMY